jgi:hypothetical protein
MVHHDGCNSYILGCVALLMATSPEGQASVGLARGVVTIDETRHWL